jgi:hypothetical protein
MVADRRVDHCVHSSTCDATTEGDKDTTGGESPGDFLVLLPQPLGWQVGVLPLRMDLCDTLIEFICVMEFWCLGMMWGGWCCSMSLSVWWIHIPFALVRWFRQGLPGIPELLI